MLHEKEVRYGILAREGVRGLGTNTVVPAPRTWPEERKIAKRRSWRRIVRMLGKANIVRVTLRISTKA